MIGMVGELKMINKNKIIYVCAYHSEVDEFHTNHCRECGRPTPSLKCHLCDNPREIKTSIWEKMKTGTIIASIIVTVVLIGYIF